MSDLFEVSLRWQDGAVQVLTYALVITAGLWVMSKIETRKEEGDK